MPCEIQSSGNRWSIIPLHDPLPAAKDREGWTMAGRERQPRELGDDHGEVVGVRPVRRDLQVVGAVHVVPQRTVEKPLQPAKAVTPTTLELLVIPCTM